MAVRREDLEAPGAIVYRFPTQRVRARVARQRRAAVARRRLALGMTALLVVIVGLLATGPAEVAPASEPSAPPAVVVQPGDTLWQLAERYGPEDVDPRAYVAALADINDLHGALVAGTRIRLPK